MVNLPINKIGIYCSIICTDKTIKMVDELNERHINGY